MIIAPNDKESNGTNPEENIPPGHKASQSDPQLTELDGLKKGGEEPIVNESDKPRDNKGKKD